jgi:hypothetical protein
MMLQEMWHTVTNAIGSAFQAIWTYALEVCTYASASTINLLVVFFVTFFLASFLGIFMEAVQKKPATRLWNLAFVVLVILTVVNGVVLSVITFYLIGWLIFVAAQLLFRAYNRWWFSPVVLMLIWFLFVMRVQTLIAYGTLEIIVGLLAIVSSISQIPGQTNSDIPGQTTSHIPGQTTAYILSILAGIYIVIRGLDNVDKSMNTLPCYMQRISIPFFTKQQYIGLRATWQRYFTARQSWRTAVVAARDEWDRAEVEWGKAKVKFPKSFFAAMRETLANI